MEVLRYLGDGGGGGLRGKGFFGVGEGDGGGGGDGCSLVVHGKGFGCFLVIYWTGSTRSMLATCITSVVLYPGEIYTRIQLSTCMLGSLHQYNPRHIVSYAEILICKAPQYPQLKISYHLHYPSP